MTKIYSQANCVIIWLGEAVDNSNQALEDIRVTVEGEFTNLLNNKKS
jgi:hypothetical protein